MLRPLATAVALGGVLLFLVPATPADAQQRRVYRFCHVVYEGLARYSHQYCTFSTFAQCMATREGIGGQCDENPEWVALNQQRQQTPTKRKRAY